jgi:hypothetical protein
MTASSVGSPAGGADFGALVTDSSSTIDVIAQALERLTGDARLAAVRSLGRDEQRVLYQKAALSRPLGLSDFVPATRVPLDPVRHAGRNTLPLPGSFKFFEKRFCRPEDGSERLFGYNESPFVGTVGPGFFVALSTRGNAEWEKRGSVVIDYFQEPDGRVATSFPKVVPNSKGLSRFVYYQTRDFMRRVSEGVSIGAAYKIEKKLDHYFVLVQLD